MKNEVVPSPESIQAHLLKAILLKFHNICFLFFFCQIIKKNPGDDGISV